LERRFFYWLRMRAAQSSHPLPLPEYRRNRV
jgi:hypothetical protein